MALQRKRRIALVGTGHRGAGTWGRELIANCGEWIELVGLSDTNALRLDRARRAIGTDAPVFSDLHLMLSETRPDTLIVCTRDDVHAELIVAALEAGVDVVTEKPMTTTAEMCRRILEAERRTGRRGPREELLAREAHLAAGGVGTAMLLREVVLVHVVPSFRVNSRFT